VPVTTTLTWTPSSNAATYDVAFGTNNPPSTVSTGQAATSYTPSALSHSTTYFWRVTANGAGGVSPGPVWSFQTQALPPSPLPSTPTGAQPTDGAATVPVTTTLTWTPSSDAATYDVAFGTSNPPPTVSTDQAPTSYTPSALSHSTTYFWRVTAKGAGGLAPGPVWSFQTENAPPPPPPVNNTALRRLRVLNWNLHMGYNPMNMRNDYNLQLDLIASLAPDVVTLQEVFLGDADMRAIYVDGLTQRTGKAWRGVFQAGNTETVNVMGAMVLTWLPIDQSAQTLLFDDPTYPAGIVGIQITVNSAPIFVSTTHLYPWDAQVRARQIVGVQNWMSFQGARRIIAADFNAFPGEATIWTPTWKEEYTDAWTTATSWVQPTDDDGYTFDRRSATGRPERIDYQWSKNMSVSEMFVVKTRRSDHHMIVTDYAP
jgi:endonuclease/exonuclease/phosphatase family metal-dependent hydrolase